MGSCVRPPCIVTEFMPGGSLYDALHHKGVTLDHEMVLKMAMDIAEGMVHLHSLNILHRDLTSKNILVGGGGGGGGGGGVHLPNCLID